MMKAAMGVYGDCDWEFYNFEGKLIGKKSLENKDVLNHENEMDEYFN